MNFEYKLNSKDKDIYFYYEKNNKDYASVKTRIYLFYGNADLYYTKIDKN